MSLEIDSQDGLRIEPVRGPICAWQGCDRTTQTHIQPEWLHLFVLPSVEVVRALNSDLSLADFLAAVRSERDAVLCPRHAAELRRRLKPLASGLGAAPDRPMRRGGPDRGGRRRR